MASSRSRGQCERDQEGTGVHPGIRNTAKLFASRHKGLKAAPLLLGTLPMDSVRAASGDADNAETSVRKKRWG